MATVVGTTKLNWVQNTGTHETLGVAFLIKIRGSFYRPIFTLSFNAGQGWKRFDSAFDEFEQAKKFANRYLIERRQGAYWIDGKWSFVKA